MKKIMSENHDSTQSDAFHFIQWRLDLLDKAMEQTRTELKTIMSEGIQQINGRVDAMDTRMNRLDDKIERNDLWQTGAEVRIKGVESTITNLENDWKKTVKLTPLMLSGILGVCTIIVSIVAIVVSALT